MYLIHRILKLDAFKNYRFVVLDLRYKLIAHQMDANGAELSPEDRQKLSLNINIESSVISSANQFVFQFIISFCLRLFAKFIWMNIKLLFFDCSDYFLRLDKYMRVLLSKIWKITSIRPELYICLLKMYSVMDEIENAT